MDYRRQSIMLGAGLFATASLWLSGPYALASMDSPTAVMAASYSDVARASVSQDDQSPYQEGYSKGYADAYAGGEKFAYEDCQYNGWNTQPDYAQKEGAYWQGYRDAWNAAFGPGYDKGHLKYCHPS